MITYNLTFKKTNMKRILTIPILVLCALSSSAQKDKESDKIQEDLKTKVVAKNEGWTKGGLVNIGLTQAMLEN